MSLEQSEKIALYVSGVLMDLEDQCLVDRPKGHSSLSLKGVSLYDQLRASGFRPSAYEVEVCLEAIRRSTGEDYEEELPQLIVRYDEIQAKLENVPPPPE